MARPLHDAGQVRAALQPDRVPAGWENYGWYQARFAERAREVFAQQGLDFIWRVRRELPWDRYAEWRADELLLWLEEIEPGFVAWARTLAR